MARTFIVANRGWKIFGIVVISILIAVGVFFAIAAIFGHINGLTCIEQIQVWFGIIKAAIEPVEEAVEDTAVVLLA